MYDPDTGQLLTGSYMDDTMPRADDLPSFTLDHTVTPCTHNPLGVRDIAMSATAERVWRAANPNA